MRQGKFSELIHNSGAAEPSTSSSEVAEAGEGDDGDDDGFFDPEQYDSEDDQAVRKKGKGAKGKGKAKRREVYAAGGCDFATVEVWFREIIDSVCCDHGCLCPHTHRRSLLTFPRCSHSLARVTTSPSSPIRSSLSRARSVATTRRATRSMGARQRRARSSNSSSARASTSPTTASSSFRCGQSSFPSQRVLALTVAHTLQGEVESIAQMKPKGSNDHEEGLLEYLEDIIGTARYKPLIEEAALEVERLGDDRQVQMNRVKLVEKEKSSLEVRALSRFSFCHKLR